MQNYLKNQNLVLKKQLFFVLSFESDNDQESYKKCYLLTVEIKDSNVITYGQNLFDQSVKYDLRTCYNIQKVATGQSDCYTTGFLLDYLYFEKYYNLIAIDYGKQ